MKRRTGAFLLRTTFGLILLVSTERLWAGGSAETPDANAVRGSTSEVPEAVAPPALPGVALVELFTSEGCSSCPPADRMLASLMRREGGRQVYALAWHVDYWDYLGWKDPYGSKTATARQRLYARAFGEELFTPEVIVGGTHVASYAGNENEIQGLVSEGLRSPARVALQLGVRLEGNRMMKVRVTTRGNHGKAVVGVAMVEDDLVQHPTTGENAGRTLRHTNVVRAFATLPAGGGTVNLKIPTGMPLDHSRIIAFVQDPTSLEIIGANRANLDVVAGGTVSARVGGKVLDGNGTGVGGVLVQACSDTLCIPAKSDARGEYVLRRIPAGSYVVKLHPSGKAEGSFLSLPVAVYENEDISLPAVNIGG